MKILIVEDTDERIDVYREVLAEHELHIFKKCQPALDALKTDKFDFAYLDHDLYDYEGPEKHERTGFEVAFAIANLPEERKPERVVVHSINVMGAANMMIALCNAGIKASWCPFRADYIPVLP